MKKMKIQLETKILYKQMGVNIPKFIDDESETDFIVKFYKSNSIEQLIVSFNYNKVTENMFFTVLGKGSFAFDKTTLTWYDIDKNATINFEDDSDVIEVQMSEFERECFKDAENIVNNKLYKIINK